MKAIQDHYPPEFAHCYGCGPANPHGLHLKSYLDDDGTVARITPDPMFSGGVPGNLYGGMIASLLDCHGTASAAGFAYRTRGRAMGDGGEPIRFVTASLKVDYRRPTPIGVELVIRGRLVSLEGRKAIVALTLHAGDDLCAEGEMIAVEFRKPA
ncbi:PaaI family thioesterase [Paracoccus versutus]|uniref:Acyl-coenzyme A thioesterase THEM4 n=1 Tax=Paracoccus versutus TaxID=34007 RepID=A0A3D9XWI1_PARVE|nr:PaaI family thioesterase [Paracoccus versutus]REF72602.1 acyl-coenzyme A thioesterase PaaI-like protein [Paracoccus versutus]WGR55452.1 PaaI family thioesterase [Paracoccus versutus]